jgi:F-type H+-transporting ATPase subunit delta
MKVSAKQYAQTLFELTVDKSDADVDDVVVRFVAFMKKMGDRKKSRDVINQFNNIHNAKNNVVEAVVTSARTLDGNVQENVQSFVRKEYGATSVILNNVIDKDIKGGIVVRVGDEVLDGSVSGRLKQLKNGLKY